MPERFDPDLLADREIRRIEMDDDREMTPQEEYEFYLDPKNLEPLGPPVWRKTPLNAPVPVRFSPEAMAEIKRRAAADDRSVSAWIRRVVEAELNHPA